MAKISISPYVHTFPAPAVLIGCGSVKRSNLITCSWFGTVNSDPPMVSVSIRSSRFSHDLVMETGEFTVNIPMKQDLAAVKICGKKSGRDVNKAEMIGWTARNAEHLDHAPRFEEAMISLGCKVRSHHALGSHTMFIAEVVGLYAEESLRKTSKLIRANSAEQLIYLDGRYWTLKPVDEESLEK